MINEFKNQNRFLSNFYILENPIKIGILEFDSNEHFYQAHKTLDLVDRIWISGIETPGKAKRAGSEKGLDGRKIQLREDWKKEEIKRVVMYTGLIMKFMGNYNIASKLIATNNKELIEGNWWHDNYWGDCKCDKCRHIVGENNLGKLLMLTRDMLTLIRI